MSRLTNNRITNTIAKKFEKSVVGVLQKYGRGYGFPTGENNVPTQGEINPPYERQIPPSFLYQIRRNNALVNNSIEEKVNQTFRRGFADWEKAYVAKCPHCDEEFESYEPFRKQLGEEGADIEADEFDFDHPRPCPDCEEMAVMQTPDQAEREMAQNFFDQANVREREDNFLDGERQSSVSQTFLEVCKEVAWDVESFDDGWMVFEREYWIDNDGCITDWDLKGVHRAPPELMRYSTDEKGNKGDKWVCPQCRATEGQDYQPDDTGDACDDCGNKTYRAYAERLDQPNGRAEQWYIRGEFAHGSEYEPSRFYGFSPIMSVYEEAKTLENMNQWYKEAYEQRRAPRGAMVVRSSNAESVRSWNQQQMEELKNDPNHIPTFIDDTDGKGDPLTWQPLLEEPAQMQHMQMREYFLKRISAKFGVTAVFQNAASDDSGLSQSMEIIVSNRSAQRLKAVFDDVFIPAFLSQLQIEGWDKEISRVEEEDEMAEVDRVGKELQNAQTAQQVGASVEWTPDDDLKIAPGELVPPEEGAEEEGGPMGGGGGGPMNMLAGGPGGPGPEGADGGPGGPGPGPDTDKNGVSGPEGGRPYESETTGGEPRSPGEPKPDNPLARSDGAAVTTDSSGYSNATYGGSGGVIDILDHLRDQANDDETDADSSDVIAQAKAAYDSQFASRGIESDDVAKAAEHGEFTRVYRNTGSWQDTPQGREATKKLYNLITELTNDE